MIVKMQRPLSTNAPIPTALVYNADRSIQFQVPFEVVADLFTSVELKVYVDVNVIAGVMHVVKKVDPRPW